MSVDIPQQNVLVVVNLYQGDNKSNDRTDSLGKYGDLSEGELYDLKSSLSST